MFAVFLACTLACSGDPTVAETDSAGSGSDSAGTSDSGETPATARRGCVSGRLRDYNNGSARDIALDAFREGLCEPLGSAVSESDGSFCLGGLPVEEPVVVQATFVGRCAWPHGKTITIPLAGTCETGDCAVLDTWFECDGESASCP